MSENHRIRFMYNNLLELSSTIKSFSSEQDPTFFTNVFNKNRSQYWSPSGCFDITALNNKIYLIDGGGAKNATVPVLKYATPALLATAITTALNAVSTNWLCEYMPNFTFKISRTTDATLQYSSVVNSIWEVIGHVSNVDSFSSLFNADEVRNHTGEYCEFDFGYNAQVRFIALIGLIDEEFTLSTDAIFRVRANNVNDFTAPPLDINCEITRSGVLQFFVEETSPYRYWRIDIVDKRNISGPLSFKFSNFYMGDYMSFTDRNIGNGITETVIDLSTKTTSENGTRYYDRKTKYSEFNSASFTLIKKDQKKAILDFFKTVGKTEAFYISFDPLIKISSSIEEYTRFVTWKDDPGMIQVLRDYHNVNLSFEEVV